MKYLLIFLFIFLLFNIPAFGQFDKPLDSRLNRIYRDMSNEDAITELTKDLGVDPNNANLFLERADNYLKLNNYEAALFDVKSAVSLKPKDLYTLCESLRILIRSGQVYEGMKIAESIIALDSTKPIGYVARSEVKFADKDYKGAFEDILKSYQFAPLDKRLDTGRVFFILNLFLKNDENILNYYNQILAVIEDRLIYAAQKHKDQPKFTKLADRELRKPVVSNLQSTLFAAVTHIYIIKVKMYEEKGQFEKADEMIERIGQYEPQFLSLYARIRFNSSKKRHEKKLADWTKLIEILEEYPDFQSLMYENRGDLYVFLKKYEEAIADFKSAIALDKKLEPKLKEKIIEAEGKIEESKNQQR